ncbi:hypothetical protein E2562_023305 [Oryza meyeriana var. granulata]|uniref:Uncharacterized protein n=1 Tax=Oryza meyeriana var. granulata TaxID=110450 RepID=A0A6G1DN10_9ORYZ|nr:hypothetical protein E2562_023305 [Oryza meyeriana var. granulata]
MAMTLNREADMVPTILDREAEETTVAKEDLAVVIATPCRRKRLPPRSSPLPAGVDPVSLMPNPTSSRPDPVSSRPYCYTELAIAHLVTLCCTELVAANLVTLHRIELVTANLPIAGRSAWELGGPVWAPREGIGGGAGEGRGGAIAGGEGEETTRSRGGVW